jgi:hypothetical protein
VAGGPGRCPAGQFWPDDVAVAGAQVVYAGRLDGCAGRRQEGRVVVAESAGDSPVRNVVARFPRSGFIRVAATQRFLAWNRDRGEVRNSDLREPKLVVYDRVRRQRAYSVTLPSRLRVTGISSLDVQSDGKVAAQISRDAGVCSIPQLVWSAPSGQPRLRFIPGRSEVGLSSEVKLVGDRLMYVRSARRGCSSSGSDLVVSSLDSSKVRVLGHYDLGNGPQRYPGASFDFDGTRSAWAESVSYRDEPERSWTSIFVEEVR